MKYNLNNKDYDVFITRKGNKNTYIRVKNDGIYVTTSYFVPNISIKSLLDKNKEYLLKRIDSIKKSNQNDNEFCLFGKKYEIIYMDTKTHIIGDKLYVSDNKTLEKWMNKEIREVFLSRLDYIYKKFEEDIPYPSLKIRKMTTRWGVCNRKNKSITLNYNLIREEVYKIDYVIIHELSHFVHFDHSKQFWATVIKYELTYKKIRKELKG